ncbi:MAG: glycosyltransferase family 4 protein [Methylococcaceae bacterium]
MTPIFLTTHCQLQRIIFWEPCISPHKTDFLTAIAVRLPEVEIICCAEQGLQEERKVLGWTVSNCNQVRTIIAPDITQIEDLVFENSAHTLHIFSGTRYLPTLVIGLKTVKSCNARFAIMAEPRVYDDWKGGLRFLQSWLTEGWLRKNCAFVLAIGLNGPPWYKSVGYDPKKIFPFAYFVPPPQLAEARLNTRQKPSDSSIISVGYLGRLVAMKGIFDLVKAVHQLGKKARLTIVGTGPDEVALKEVCLQYKIEVDFRGVLPIQWIGEVLEELDVLVLASTSKDGWGVVVSEALMSGTAVVATHCVGASLMLDSALFGYKIVPNSPDEIAKAIKQLKANDAFTTQNRLARQLLARAKLSPEAGARYLADIINYQLGGGDKPAPFFLYEDDLKSAHGN